MLTWRTSCPRISACQCCGAPRSGDITYVTRPDTHQPVVLRIWFCVDAQAGRPPLPPAHPSFWETAKGASPMSNLLVGLHPRLPFVRQDSNSGVKTRCVVGLWRVRARRLSHVRLLAAAGRNASPPSHNLASTTLHKWPQRYHQEFCSGCVSSPSSNSGLSSEAAFT